MLENQEEFMETINNTNLISEAIGETGYIIEADVGEKAGDEKFVLTNERESLLNSASDEFVKKRTDLNKRIEAGKVTPEEAVKEDARLQEEFLSSMRNME